jgi:hypothetical protein
VVANCKEVPLLLFLTHFDAGNLSPQNRKYRDHFCNCKVSANAVPLTLTESEVSHLFIHSALSSLFIEPLLRIELRTPISGVFDRLQQGSLLNHQKSWNAALDCAGINLYSIILTF